MFRVWWWSILVFFEKNIKHPLPNEFEIPRLVVERAEIKNVSDIITPPGKSTN